MNFAAEMLKILTAFSEGMILYRNIEALVAGLTDASGTPIQHLTDEKLLALLMKRTKTPAELLQEGRDSVG